MMVMNRRVRTQKVIPWVLGALAAGRAAGACGGWREGSEPRSGDGLASGSASTGGDTGGATGPLGDFPATPILDAPAGAVAPPVNAGDLFGPAGTGDASGGPCLLEPAPGTLYPKNWLRPRFRFAPAGNQNLFEIRIKAPSEINELIVYTRATAWKMPLAVWRALAQNQQDVPITVTIRGAELVGDVLSGPPRLGTSGELRIAPAPASGSIVYWRTIPANGAGELKGFSVGDESVVLALKPDQVAPKPGSTAVTSCLGCHASTPDGQFAAFKTMGSTGGGTLASLSKDTTGDAPKFWSMASIDAMNTYQLGAPSFSQAHWRDGDRTLLTSLGNGSSAALAWFDLEANQSGEGLAFGFLARDGDARGALMPAFSHDGQSIVYISTNGSRDGRPNDAPTDLYSVPFQGRKGGAATPVEGASDPAYSEYYPAFSPDDQLLAWNRITAGKDTYDQQEAEVFILPAKGGSPTRLAANDPVACGGEKSPGVTNSWPKWAPEAVTVGDRTFYWLTFSSRRGGGLPQLYITAVVAQGGKVTTYPALYLWNQPSDEANHTPAWDVFDIPSPPIK